MSHLLIQQFDYQKFSSCLEGQVKPKEKRQMKQRELVSLTNVELL